MSARPAAPLLAAALLFGTPAAGAHDLQYAVEPGKAVIVRLYYSDSARFTYEAYEVFRAGEKVPYQVGRTDAHGRFAFVPDRTGGWRVKATSGDGHGTEFTLRTDEAQSVADRERSLFDRHARIVTGVAVLFGLFGLLALFYRKKGP